MSVNACSDEASCPLDWRLFIPKEWDADSDFNQQRREKAKLPDDAHHVEKWRLALEMISWGIKPPVVLGDGAYGDITEFRSRLEQRELSYVLDVKGVTLAYSEEVGRERPEYRGRGCPPAARYRQAPSSLRALALAAGKRAAVTVTWREGTRGKMSSRFLGTSTRHDHQPTNHAEPVTDSASRRLRCRKSRVKSSGGNTIETLFGRWHVASRRSACVLRAAAMALTWCSLPSVLRGDRDA